MKYLLHEDALKVELIEPIYRNNFKILNNSERRERKKIILSKKKCFRLRAQLRIEKMLRSINSKGELLIRTDGFKELLKIKLKNLNKENILSSFSLLLNENIIDNKNFNTVSFYNDYLKTIKDTILQMQSYFINSKPKNFNDSVKKLEKLIDDINKLASVYIESIKLLKKGSKRVSSKKSFATYECTICCKLFSTGQGLGGHMSRIHPNKSEKYKLKRTIRESRTDYRNTIIDAKRKILAKYGYDFDEMRKERKNKQVIKNILFKYNKEYKKLTKEIKESFINSNN